MTKNTSVVHAFMKIKQQRNFFLQSHPLAVLTMFPISSVDHKYGMGNISGVSK